MTEIFEEPELVHRAVVFPNEQDHAITEVASEANIGTNLMVLGAVKHYLENKGVSFEPDLLDNADLNIDMPIALKEVPIL